MKSPRTVFALPFVIVVGCGGAQGTTSQPVMEPAAKTEELPPPPEGTPTEEAEGVLAYPSGDKVYVNKDGTCTAQFAEKCGESDGTKPVVVSSCNPPPPQRVRCPVEAK